MARAASLLKFINQSMLFNYYKELILKSSDVRILLLFFCLKKCLPENGWISSFTSSLTTGIEERETGQSSKQRNNLPGSTEAEGKIHNYAFPLFAFGFQ